MKPTSVLSLLLALGLSLASLVAGQAQDKAKPDFTPRQGQAGKDVIWVPTPDVTVQKMLDVANATPDDYVIDLGSGDGRLVIAAAKRGIRGHGVEFNPDMVEYARRKAAEAGVADKASFVRGDMFEADISRATLLPLFLLSENLEKLVANFLKLKPGTRIVINGYQIYGWQPDLTTQAEGDCGHWCTVHLYIVPAQIGGAWRLGDQALILRQDYQKVSGTLGGAPLEDVFLNGAEIAFRAGKAQYRGRVDGNVMRGQATGSTGGAWMARKI